eukprot:COSAG02_NODE_76625_length_133_cov_42.088235_1_plen_26_part_10
MLLGATRQLIALSVKWGGTAQKLAAA